MGPSSFAAVASLEFLIGPVRARVRVAQGGERTYAGAAMAAGESAPPPHEVTRDALTTHMPAG